ncbi:MAG: yidC [Chlorobi bacterium]|nr:yidC [Chlorobiota bacterium]
MIFPRPLRPGATVIMDKRTTLAFVLIAVIMVAWYMYFGPKAPQQSVNTPRIDTVAKPAATPAPAAIPQVPLTGKYLAATQGDGRLITIKSPLYTAIFNTRGALLSRFTLNHYKTWYGDPVQLISDSVGFPGELGLEYVAAGGVKVPTESMIFTVDAPQDVTLGEKDSVVITARVQLGGASAGDSAGAAATPAQTIEKRFIFRGNSYGIGLDVAMNNMAGELSQGGYDITWKKGLKYQEHNSVDESGKAKSLAVVNGDLTEVDASDVSKVTEQKFTGLVNWVGTHVKYFGAAIIPAVPQARSAAAITGVAATADSGGRVESYDLSLHVPVQGVSNTQRFTVFVGPLDYDVAKSFGIQGMLDFGARFLIRPIGEFFMLPIFRFLHRYIANYGVVIIIFTLLIRLPLWPLSIPQIKSAKKMQLLQPIIAEIREKHKDDQQKQQMETMALYREYGINPVGGCLPMILQMPILYALWGTLSSAIDLRQASFALWIKDLSIPDQIVHLPFALPLLGDKLSALALIMGATLFIQQKMMLTDPKQKAMVYFMPVLLTLAFNHLPSGLNLYYLTFNALAIGQQIYMSKFSKNTLTLEELRRTAKTKKKGWLAQKMEEAQKMAEVQQRPSGTSGGSKKVDGRTPVEPKKR